jgi:hypothetical protein
MSTGVVKVQGPLTKEDKVKWDHMYGLLEESDRVIDELTEDMKLRKTKRQRQSIEDEIADLRRVRAVLVDVIGEPKRRGGR